MKITITRDPDAGVVQVLLEVADTAAPDCVADWAWAAVDHALTNLQPRGEPSR